MPYSTTDGSVASQMCLALCAFASPACLPLFKLEHMTSTPTFTHVNYQSFHPGVKSHPRKTNQSNQKALLLECGFVTPTVVCLLFNRCWKYVEDSFHKCDYIHKVFNAYSVIHYFKVITTNIYVVHMIGKSLYTEIYTRILGLKAAVLTAAA